jgi:hypothetical protein
MMEHKPLAELQAVADVKPIETSISMSREHRLSRWIGLLKADPERKLRSLHEIEHLTPAARRECRADDSPLSVAYDDPVLRSAGLKSDRIGDCVDFFELSDRQIHHAFCSCHVGIRLSATAAAQRLRRVLRVDAFRGKVTAALWRGMQAMSPKPST